MSRLATVATKSRHNTSDLNGNPNLRRSLVSGTGDFTTSIVPFHYGRRRPPAVPRRARHQSSADVATRTAGRPGLISPRLYVGEWIDSSRAGAASLAPCRRLWVTGDRQRPTPRVDPRVEIGRASGRGSVATRR